MPHHLLAIALIDLRANLEEMGQLTRALDAAVREFDAASADQVTAMWERLGQLRHLNHENVNLLFAVDAGLGAITGEES